MKDSHFNLLRWVPVTASVAVVVLIVVLSAIMVTDLKKEANWRKHAFQTILETQTYEDDLVHAQNHVQHNLAANAPNLLIEYRKDTNSELLDFEKITELTHDEPGQQQRLRHLRAAVKSLFDYDGRVVSIYARQGADAAFKAEQSDTNADELEVAVDDLEDFKRGEENLLNTRSASEQTEYHTAAHWLAAGSILAGLMLVLANFVAGREIARRRSAEQEQRVLIERLEKALAEVKTLSGLIPICAWCKKVRNDTGYWQGVEQYVGTRTDATFSHGICPDCTDKMLNESAPKTIPSKENS